MNDIAIFERVAPTALPFVHSKKLGWPTCRPIVTVAIERFQASRYVCLRSVNVEANNSNLVLRGTVNSYYYKQLAQETLRGIDGVRTIQNCLEVTEAVSDT